MNKTIASILLVVVVLCGCVQESSEETTTTTKTDTTTSTIAAVAQSCDDLFTSSVKLTRCKNEYAIYHNDISSCSQEGSGLIPGACRNVINDESCDKTYKISTPDEKNICRFKKAIRKEDISYCEQMEGSQAIQYKEFCLALLQNDINSVPSGYESLFHFERALKERDKTLCNQISKTDYWQLQDTCKMILS